MGMVRRVLRALDQRLTTLLEARRDDVEDRWTLCSGRPPTERWAPGEGGGSVVWLDRDGRPWRLDAERIAQLLWTSAPLATAEAAVAGLVELVAGRAGVDGGP